MNRFVTLLRPETTTVFIVDMQEKLLPVIHEGRTAAEAAQRLALAAAVLELPVMVTEQYPAGLGPTCASLQTGLAQAPRFTKTCFSGCTEEVVSHLRRLDRSNIVVAGVEAHVCVQQTVLDLLRRGFLPFVCADAVGSRRVRDCETALQRMRQAGAVITTTESVIFELVGEAGTDQFKRILRIVK